MASSFKILIPARLNSQRLKKKLVERIEGKTIIQHTWEQCRKTKAEAVIVVTDSEEIFQIITDAGGEAFLSEAEYTSGTDRINEFSLNAKLAKDELLINVQGDEPLIEVEAIDQLAKHMEENNFSYGTLAKPFKSDRDLLDENKVKVILDKDGKSKEFFRNLPSEKHNVSDPVYHHVGVYAFKVEFLNLFSSLEISHNEREHKLEQMRALDNNLDLQVLLLNDLNSWGIDTQEDLDKLKNYLS